MRRPRQIWRHHADAADTAHSRAGRSIQKWRIAIPYYDIRECPRCGAAAVGRLAQAMHDRDHDTQDAWQEDMAACLWALHDAVKAALGAAGIELNVPEFAAEPQAREAGEPRKMTGYVVGESHIEVGEYAE